MGLIVSLKDPGGQLFWQIGRNSPNLSYIITLRRVASSIVVKNSYKTTFILVYVDYIS